MLQLPKHLRCTTEQFAKTQGEQKSFTNRRLATLFSLNTKPKLKPKPNQIHETKTNQNNQVFQTFASSKDAK